MQFLPVDGLADIKIHPHFKAFHFSLQIHKPSIRNANAEFDGSLLHFFLQYGDSLKSVHDWHVNIQEIQGVTLIATFRAGQFTMHLLECLFPIKRVIHFGSKLF